MTRFIEVTHLETGKPTLIGIDSIKFVGGCEHAEIQIGEGLLVIATESYKEVRDIIDHVGQRRMITNNDSWVHGWK